MDSKSSKDTVTVTKKRKDEKNIFDKSVLTFAVFTDSMYFEICILLSKCKVNNVNTHF